MSRKKAQLSSEIRRQGFVRTPALDFDVLSGQIFIDNYRKLIRGYLFPVLFIVLILLSSCQSEPQFAVETDLQLERPLPELISFLQDYIPEQMDRHHVPGLSMALIREGQVVWTESFGVTNSLTRTPVTEETIFEAASLGKPIAAFGALQLVESGDMMLDRPLDEYLSQPFLLDPQGRDEISLRNVLSHSAGLSNNMEGFDTQVYFPPGQEFQYSGMGYLYAQATVEFVSSMSFEAYVQESVFEPLDMIDSSYQWQADRMERVSHGHLTGLNLFALLGIGYLVIWVVVFVLQTVVRILRTKRFTGWRMIGNSFLALFLGVGFMALISYNTTLPLPFDLSKNREPNAASSLYATTDDMAAFLLQFLDADNWAEIQEQMLAEQIQVDENLYWGNGIGLQKNRDGRISFWQWGSNIDFQGFMIGYPEEQIGVVILTNSSNGLALVPGIVEQAVGGEQYWWSMVNE